MSSVYTVRQHGNLIVSKVFGGSFVDNSVRHRYLIIHKKRIEVSLALPQKQDVVGVLSLEDLSGFLERCSYLSAESIPEPKTST